MIDTEYFGGIAKQLWIWVYAHSSFDNLYAFVLAKPLENCPQFLAQFSVYDFTSFFRYSDNSSSFRFDKQQVQPRAILRQ